MSCCAGGCCMIPHKPEEQIATAGFLVAAGLAISNFFVANTQFIKRNFNQTRRFALFFVVPMIAFGLAIQHGLVEVPTYEQVMKKVFGDMSQVKSPSEFDEEFWHEQRRMLDNATPSWAINHEKVADMIGQQINQ